MTLLRNLNLVDILSTAIALLLGITLHEFAHAWAANRLGDPTPRLHGRVTLNPLAHFDPIGGLMILLTLFGLAPIGWGKPVPINPYYLRWGRKGMVLATLAGPLSNLSVALVVATVLRLGWTAAPAGTAGALASSRELLYLVYKLVVINVALAVFNLIPIPPLDGFHVLEGLAPPSWDRALGFVRQYGVWILLLLLVGGGVGLIVGPLYRALAYPLLQLAGLL